MEPSSRAAALVSYMNSVARQVRLSAGGKHFEDTDGASRVLEISRNYFAPGDAGSINKGVARFIKFRRTGETVGRYIAEYGLLQRKAGSKIDMGAGFPGQFVTILCMQNAGHYRQEKSLARASSQKSLKLVDVAANMRRLFGSCGRAARRDILATEAADGPLGGDGDQEACATYKQAKTQGVGQKRREGVPRLVQKK